MENKIFSFLVVVNSESLTARGFYDVLQENEVAAHMALEDLIRYAFGSGVDFSITYLPGVSSLVIEEQKNEAFVI